MKTPLKKILSVLLSAALLLSLFPAVFASFVSAEEAESEAFKALGAWKNECDLISIVKDPAGGDEDVFRMHSTGNGTGYIMLKDPVEDKPFEPVAEHYYTVSFDYYNAVSSAEIKLMYGNNKYFGNASNGDAGRIQVSRFRDFLTTSGFSTGHQGDGAWHTVTMSFKARTVMGQNISTTVLKYLMISAQRSEGLDLYFKNIEIVDNGVAAAGVYGAKGTGSGNGSIVKDPAGGDDLVVKLAGDKDGRLSLTNNNNGVVHFQPDVQYTVEFEYYLETASSEFLFYGSRVTHNATSWLSYENSHSTGNSGWNMKVTSNQKANYNQDFAKDGKWHKYYYTFKVDSTDTTEQTSTWSEDETEGTTVGETSANKLSLYKNLVINFGGTAYIKNVKISGGGKLLGTEYSEKTDTLDIRSILKDDGNGVYTKNEGTSSTNITNFSIGNDNGEHYVTIEGHSRSSAAGSSTSADYLYGIFLHTSGGVNATGNYAVTKGLEYIVTFDYKIEAGTDSTVKLGIASFRATENFGYSYEYTDKIGTTDGWQTYYATFVPASDNYYLGLATLVYGGSADNTTKTHLKNVTITRKEQTIYTAEGDAVVLNAYDNGVNYKIGAWKGDTIPEITNNAENSAIGEERMGWYEKAQFRAGYEPVTAIPEDLEGNEYNIYARYPTTIIDYNHINPAVSTAYSLNGSVTSDYNAKDGAFTATLGNAGYRLNGYDAPGLDDMGFAFKDGVKYKIDIYYQLNTAKNMQIFPLQGSGSYGSNVADKYSDDPTTVITRVPGTAKSKDISVPAKEIDGTDDINNFACLSFEFTGTHEFIGKNNSNVDTAATQGEYLLIRSVGVLRIAKVMVSELSDECYAAGLQRQITLNYNDGTGKTETIGISDGQVIELPIPEARTGYIFAGWYSTDVDSSKQQQIAGCHIPNHVIQGTPTVTKSFNAVWVSTTPRKTDFTESIYSTIAGGSGTMSGSWEINTGKVNEGTDDEVSGIASFSNDSPNNYKVSLFDEDGNKYILYDGVTYEIKIKYKRTAAGSKDDHAIGVTRNGIHTYGPMLLTKVANGTSVVAVADDNTVSANWIEAKAQFTVFGTYIANDGATEGISNLVKNELSLSVRSGAVDVDYVEVTALGFTPLYKTVENATVDVDYQNMKVTVTPDAGYEIVDGSVSTLMQYRDFKIEDVPTEAKYTEADKAAGRIPEGSAVGDTYTKQVPTCFATENEPVVLTNGVEGDNHAYTYSFDFGGYSGGRISAMHFLAEVEKTHATVELDLGNNTVERLDIYPDGPSNYTAPTKEDCILGGWYDAEDTTQALVDLSELKYEADAENSFDGKTYNAQWYTCNLKGYTVTLGGRISVNFFMELDAALVDNDAYSAKFNVSNGRTKVMKMSEGVENTQSGISNSLYVFSCGVAAKELVDDINVQFVSDDAVGSVYSYSVKKYADYIINNAETYGENDVNLVKSLLTYGAAAQTYFEYKEDKLVSTDVAADVTDDLTAYEASQSNSNMTDVKLIGASAVWGDSTIIRYQIGLKGDATTDNVTVTYGDTALSFKATGKQYTNTNGTEDVTDDIVYDLYILDSSGIVAKDMDDSKELKIVHGDEENTVTYSVYSYIYTILDADEGTYTDNLIAFAKAAYAFGKTSNAYFTAAE